MKHKLLMILFLLTALLLSGCTMMTIDQMYCLPRRSDEYNNLQSAMDAAMVQLEYCAPVSGDNQQTVQIADLDGDGALEYLIFARDTVTQPLRILIFRNVGGEYVLADTIKSNGTEFDRVEYMKMDNSSATMLVVGKKISDQVMRSLSVYTYSAQGAEQLVSVNYSEFLPTDLDNDGFSELFVLRSGLTEADGSVAEFYTLRNGIMERSNEATVTQPVDKLERVLTGKLQDGVAGVFAEYSSSDTTISTDVFTIRDGFLCNITQANAESTGIQTSRNYYVYSNDIDDDGVLELPDLLTPVDNGDTLGKQDIILWYALNSSGEKINKIYTYHNFVGGWYLQLANEWADEVTVSYVKNRYEFFVHNEKNQASYRVMTIFVTDNQIWENSEQKGDILLQTTQLYTYTASLEDVASAYGITKEFVLNGFYLIQEDWRTGEM